MAVVALSLGACAAQTRVPATAIEPRGPILVIGDSIMVGARDFGELASRLSEHGWTPEIVAEEGRTVSWALQQVEPRSTVPAVVVVGLGSNPGSALGTFPDEVAALVAALVTRGARSIVWVPPHQADAERYAERARALQAAAGNGLAIPAWPSRLAANPQWFSGDGLHLTGEGYGALAAFIVEQVSTL